MACVFQKINMPTWVDFLLCIQFSRDIWWCFGCCSLIGIACCIYDNPFGESTWFGVDGLFDNDVLSCCSDITYVVD